MTNPQDDMIATFELVNVELEGPQPKRSIAQGDPLPPGPYRVGLVHGPKGQLEWPYTIECADGRAIAGHVNSKACAEAIAAAMNAWSSRQ